jgi:glycosyltransferase involved in cell wall biosynthesis
MSKHPLVLVPLEPLAERYTESWYRNFPKLFDAAGFEVTVVDGVTLEDEVKVGTFLDINSTTHYKWTQLQMISKLFHLKRIANGTVFFFADTEFWGLESIRLLAQMNKVKIFITSFLHAASYTREDAFAVAQHYQRYTEVGWIACSDLVFVGSSYHKQQVVKERLRPLGAKPLESRILVTKNPLFLDDYPLAADPKALHMRKKRKILMTNRFDREKRPDETMNLFAKLAAKFPDWEFVVTTGRSRLTGDPKMAEFYATTMHDLAYAPIQIKLGLTKAQYHQELAEAAIVVTHSIEENYGYCVAEALLHQAHVVAREGLSHSEFLPLPFLFNSDQDVNMDEQVVSTLMRKFGTPEWPTVNTVDTNGAVNIVTALQRLVS